jgi:hypothetical protein
MKDGECGSYSTYTYEKSGQRKMTSYATQPCRINTYGDSFTQCQQVSDDETWQERLASHIGEPVRNFGCGGYGVYQAYRRALRMEANECSSEYIILGIFDDDHVRNLDAARWIRTQWQQKDRPPEKSWPLHGLPWDHIRFDLDKRSFVEKTGFCRTEDDLRTLCDPEKFYEVFRDDQIVRLFVLEIGGQVDYVDDLQALAKIFDVEVDLKDPKRRRDDALRLHTAYGLKSTEYVLEKMCQWLEDQGKKLMVILFYPKYAIRDYITRNYRFDEPFLKFLAHKNILYIDTLLEHVADYKAYGLSNSDYLDRFYIQPAGAAFFGHYNPTGNFFIATSIKNEIINWLSPKPPAYRTGGLQRVYFPASY